MNPNSLVHLRKLLLPSSRSHWSATEPRNKTRTTASTHTQRKHTRQGCWQHKPVRPVSETGRTAPVGLSLTKAGKNRSDRLGKPVRPILSRNSPKTPNTSKAFPHLNKRSHGAVKTSLFKDLSRQPTGRNRSDRFGKPVRPVLA
jgi:hypothetical protein